MIAWWWAIVSMYVGASAGMLVAGLCRTSRAEEAVEVYAEGYLAGMAHQAMADQREICTRCDDDGK